MEFVNDYVLVDIETTGLSPVNNEIIEIGALRVRNNIIVDTFSYLIKPSSIIPYYITNITGITNDMVEFAPSISEVLIKFNEFLGNDVLIAHNARFDISFLRNNFLKYLNINLNNNYIDTLVLSRKYLPNLDSHKLSVLADYFNISYNGAHRGLRDCEITKMVYDNISNIVHINV